MVIRRVAAAILAAFALAHRAQAADSADFYHGKQITIFIGSSAGGGYDSYARLVARYLGTHIPGNPTVVPQNMPGAGQTRAAGYVFSIASKDGTAIAAVSPGALLVPLLGGPKIQFDPSKFNYIGSANSDIYTCVVRPDAPVKAFKDTFTTELILGVSTGTTHDMPMALNNVLGTKLKLVTGYPGTKETSLALLRGEVQGICGFGYASVISQYPDWLPSGTVKLLAQENAKGHPDLNRQGVPRTIDFARTDEERQVLELIYSQGIFGRPFVVAPEVPASRVAVLRAAFWKTMTDPQLIADAHRMNLEIDPLSGADTQALVTAAYATPAPIVERAKKALDIPETAN
jgi:tripartite-type tricarboxylate transporter receptor subunit TctC